jgi:exonuclease III
MKVEACAQGKTNRRWTRERDAKRKRAGVATQLNEQQPTPTHRSDGKETASATATNGGLRVGTLNVRTLQLQGIDNNSLRTSARFNEVVDFMVDKELDILAIQETRFDLQKLRKDLSENQKQKQKHTEKTENISNVKSNISKQNKKGARETNKTKTQSKITFDTNISFEDTVGKVGEVETRCVVMRGREFFLHIQSANKGNGGLAFITSFRGCTAQSHEHRVMSLRVPGGEPTRLFNVHAPHKGHAVEVRRSFTDNLISHFNGAQERVKLIVGDLNAAVQHADGSRMRDENDDSIWDLLEATNTVTGHCVCPARRPWTYTMLGHVRQLDHIIICRRFASAIRAHKVLYTTLPTDHLAVTATIKVKWKAPVRRAPGPAFWNLCNESVRTEYVRSIRDKECRSWSELECAMQAAGQKHRCQG